MAVPGRPAQDLAVGFMPLEEEAEGTFGTAVQSLNSVNVEHLDVEDSAGLPALSSRMSRQQGVVTLINIGYPVTIGDNTSVQTCITLLQAQQVSISLRVHGSEDKEGNKDEAGSGRTE